MTTMRSGRTTQLLDEAIERARDGDVVVVGATHQHACELAGRIQALGHKPERQLRFSIGGHTLLVVSPDRVEHVGFDNSGMPRYHVRALPNAPVLFDHYAFGRVRNVL